MSQTQIRVPIRSSDGLTLSAVAEGNAQKPCLVLVHGYPDNLKIWDAVAAELCLRYYVIRYDVRGAGFSGAPDRLSGYRLPQLLSDFRRVIDHFSAEAPVHLVGHDWGSIAGWHFASAPELAGRIASFTSISGPGLDHIGANLRRRGIASINLRQLAASWYTGVFHLPLVAPTVWKFGLAKHWPKLLARLEGLPKQARPAKQASQLRDGVNAIGLYRANLLPCLLRPKPNKLTAPLLLVVPTQDPFVKPYLLEGLEQWADDAKRVKVKAGHWLPLTKPKWLAEQIDHFVAPIAAG